MNGTLSYTNNLIEKCEKVIQKNPDIKCLDDFYNFMFQKEKSTVYAYLNNVVRFLRTVNKEAEELRLNDYTKYMNSISQKTPSYQIAVYSSLKKFSSFLYETELSAKNYMNAIERPDATERDDTIDKREIGYLNKNEIHDYINQVDLGAGTTNAIARQKEWKERDELIILLFLNTGVRCSALYKLDITSIDFEKKLVVFRDKGNKRNEVYLSNNILEKALSWLKKREILTIGYEQNDALFISNRRTRLTQLAISNIVNKYAENIKGKHITPHKLRATYGTQLYDETKDLFFVQNCMNHSNPKTTELYIRGKKEINKKKSCEIMNSLTKK